MNSRKAYPKVGKFPTFVMGDSMRSGEIRKIAAKTS
jgi:hypothetical protein